MSHTGLVVSRRMGSSQTRGQTCVPCTGRRILTAGCPGKSSKETVYNKLEPPSIVTHVAKYLQVPFVCCFILSVLKCRPSYPILQLKKKGGSEKLSHIGVRAAASLAPKLMLIIAIRATLLPTVHQSREALFVFLIKHSSNTGDYLSLVTTTVSC